MKRFLLVPAAALLFLAACQGTMTNAPLGTAQEIAQERAYQQNMSKEAQANANLNVQDVALRILGANAEFCGKRVQQTMWRNQKVWVCAYPVAIDNKDKEVNAHTDGQKIVLSGKMLGFVNNNDELALVIGHELAHAALGHVDKTMQNAALGQIGGFAVDQLLASAGVNTGGQLASLGGGLAVQRYSVSFEQEADYVGMYFMARAGFDTSNIASFWRRMGANNPSTITQRSSHPSSPERFVAIERTQREIAAKKAAGQPLVPNFAKK